MVAKMQPAAEPDDIRQLVLGAIRQEPKTRELEVSVAADESIVSLTGSVKSKSESLAVETVAKQVRAVRAVANDLEVKPPRGRSSTHIVRDVVKALRNHIFLAGEDIRVVVRAGCVILEGHVHRELHKLLAEAEVKRLRGIVGVLNLLEVKPEEPDILRGWKSERRNC
jgi:osmotically-inducible protein OsmY